MLTLSPLLERFAERTPLPVMARGLLERQWFVGASPERGPTGYLV